MIDGGQIARHESLYLRALNIREARTAGLWLPIMWHLALRGHTDAMIDLASWFSDSERLADLGAAADRFSAAGLYRRALRRGNARAAQHMSVSCFNRGDMIGYRDWLARGARAESGIAKLERKRFETRLPHGDARKIGRQRPWQRRDEFR